MTDTSEQRRRRLRLRLDIGGVVQGVGFRPFVHRLATSLGLPGVVFNHPGGVTIEVEGAPELLAQFVDRVVSDRPVHAVVEQVTQHELHPTGETGFVIRVSDSHTPAGDGGLFMLPDLATCDDCRRELLDPADRRYHYPFIVCTQCGPRWSIIDDVPYDRARTSMRGFDMCAACRAEYEDPASRRFHAEPIACADCGPQLRYDRASRGCEAPEGEASERREQHRVVPASTPPGVDTPDSPLTLAAAAVLAGRIVAVLGLGGFHLVCDATNAAAVRTLRERKRRPQKPFALMVESLAAAQQLCAMDAAEQSLLAASPSPIVVLRKRAGATPIADDVAPGNPYLGLMLPYTPLHILLLQAMGRPIVCTSGNLSDEPIQFDPAAARDKLAGIADAFLTHNRPIRRPVDDSVACVMEGEPMLLRRARGYAPLPIGTGLTDAIAFGAHEKCTVAISSGGRAVISPHIGQMDSPDAVRAHADARDTLRRLSRSNPPVVAHDAHPDFHTTRVAQTSGARPVAVQHHVAHLLSAVVEHNLQPPVLGVVWDGTGYGEDAPGETIEAIETVVPIRGSEFLLWGIDRRIQRVASLRPFPLPGGEAAIREPRRSAAGLLHALGIAHDSPWRTLLERGVNSPLCSSIGRLFDAVASLVGLCDVATHEAEAACAVEFAAMRALRSEWRAGGVSPRRDPDALLPSFALRGPAPPARQTLDPADTIASLVSSSASAEHRALAFHHALADCIADVAARHPDCRTVVLTGGCFQNRLLLTLAAAHLRAIGRQPVWPRLVPCNDGGIALGQLAAVTLLET